jgi:ketosteroid isomerase-like protein
MSQENVEIVRDQYAATNERDFERVMSHYAEDVELVVYFQDIRAGTFKGRDATGRWFGDWLSSFDRDARFDLKELTELEDGSVLVVADHHARGRASGAEVHGIVVWLYRLREGKIIRVEGYPSRDDALEAAGLRQRDDHLGR